MLYKSAIIAFLAASGVIAAPVQERDAQNDDIVVRLSGEGAVTWDATGFQPNRAKELTFNGRGPFTKAQLVISPRIKAQLPNLESTYRCALQRADGTRVIVTRGENIDFNLGDGGNPNPWTIQGDALRDGKIICDPNFKKVEKNDINAIRVTLDGAKGPKVLDFSNIIANNAGANAGTNSLNADGFDFSTAQVFLGPGIKNQALRCQVKDVKNAIVLFDRGTNLNKKTIGDAGKGAWKLAAASNKVNSIAQTVTCGPLANE